MGKNPLNSYSARDMLHSLIIPQYEDFLRKNSSIRYAVLTVLLAYHMYEWVHRVRRFTKEHFDDNYTGEDNMVELFEIAREISNDLKHCKFETNIRTQTGFSSGFSDGFARPIIVKTPQGQEISMDKLLRALVEFWKRREQLGDFRPTEA